MDYRLHIWPNYVLEWGKNRLTLTPRQGIVVSRLASRHPATYENLTESLYGHDENGGPDDPTNVIAVTICHLRKRLKDTPFEIRRVRDGHYSLVRKMKESLDDIADNVLSEDG